MNIDEQNEEQRIGISITIGKTSMETGNRHLPIGDGMLKHMSSYRSLRDGWSKAQPSCFESKPSKTGPFGLKHHAIGRSKCLKSQCLNANAAKLEK